MSRSDAAVRSDRLEEFLRAPRRALWVMALPMMAGMTVHTTYLIADTAFIGTLGTDALAAATFVAPLFFLTMALTMGLGTAVTALIAQAVGRGDAQTADSAAGTAITTGLVLGTAFGAAGLAAGPSMLELLGAEGRVAELGWAYFRVLALFMPLFFVSSVLRSILTGEGDARTPMVVLTVATVVNRKRGSARHIVCASNHAMGVAVPACNLAHLGPAQCRNRTWSSWISKVRPFPGARVQLPNGWKYWQTMVTSATMASVWQC